MMSRKMMILGFVAALGLAAAGCGKKDGDGGGKTGGEGDESGMDGKRGRGMHHGMRHGRGGKGGGKKLTKEALEKLLKVEVPGYQQAPGAKVMDMMGPMVMVYYQGTKGNAQEMTAGAQVRIYTCGACPELTAAAYKENQALFEKMMQPAAHKENKDAVFDVQEETVAGRKVVSIYQLSFAVSADGKSKGSSHGYSVYFHDSKTMLHVMVYPRAVKGYKGVESLDDLKKQLTRDEMKAAAATFLETLGPHLF